MENMNNINNEKIESKNQSFYDVKTVDEEKFDGYINVFAEGLPEWSLEPPQVMVRRRRHL